MQLGYLPRIDDPPHLVRSEIGQIYVPVVNWVLLVARRRAGRGLPVVDATWPRPTASPSRGTLAIDTLLFFVVVRLLWHKPPLAGHRAARSRFLIVDLGFFAANIPKIPHGGWFPLAIAALVFTALMTWRRRPGAVRARMQDGEEPMDAFLAQLATDAPIRVPGTAVFLTATGDGAPRALHAQPRAQPRAAPSTSSCSPRSPRGAPRAAPTAARITDLGHGITPDRAPPRLPGGGKHPGHARDGP